MSNDPPIHCAHDAVLPLDKFIPSPHNPNEHPPEQIQLFGKIIEETGWRRSIKVSKLSGRIVAGHGAWEAARAKGWTVAPVDYQDYKSEAEEAADLLADNRLPELSHIEDDKLANILKDLKIANDLAPDDEKFDLSLTAYSHDLIDDIIAGLDGEDDAGPPKVKDPKPLSGSLLELVGKAIGKSPDDLADFKVTINCSTPANWKVDLTKKQLVFTR